MNLSLVSVRYAKALFKVGVEKGILEKVYNDILLISSHCEELSGFCDFVQSPVVKPSKKKALFKDVYEETLNAATLSFLNIVIENRREKILKAIFLSFIDIYKKDKKVKTVTLYSAFEMDKPYINKVKELLIKELGEQLELKVLIKEDLLGGFILKVDDKMIDASITGKLQQIRTHLINEKLIQ